MDTDNEERDAKTETGSNPSLTNDIDPSENAKMRGDAIGNTMYSERFVLTTLLELMRGHWNDELESDLCSVWDMATEKDVVMFLLQNNFIELASEVIGQSKEYRLIEIVVGILGNMCIYQEVCEHFFIAKDYTVFLSLIDITDTMTLTQLMRLYKALLHSDINYDVLITDSVLERINFILRSSQNCELLLHTLQVTSEIVSKKRIKQTDILNFFVSANEAFRELFEKEEKDLHIPNVLTRSIEKDITAYLKVVQNIRLILTEYDNEKYNEILTLFHETTYISEALVCIETILSYCSEEELQDMRDTLEYYIYCSAQFIITFKVPFHSNILNYFLEIYHFIILNDTAFVNEIVTSLIEVIIYIVNKADLEVLQKSLKKWSKSKLRLLFIDNIINKQQCDEAFINKINTFFSSHNI